MILTIKKCMVGYECSLETPREEVLNLRKKWSKQAALLIAKEILGNGLVNFHENTRWSEDVVDYRFFISFGHKPVRLPIEGNK